MSTYETIGKDIKKEALQIEAAVESRASALWKEAYDHPLASAAAVVGTALAVGALCTHNQAVARFLAGAPKALLVEDTPGMGKALRDAIHSQGLRVSWFRGATADPLWGKMRLGSLPLNPKKYDFAIVDGDLGKNSLTGDRIVSQLHRDNPNMLVVGSSSQPDMNLDMRKAGADLAARKDALVGMLASNHLPLNETLGLKRSVGSVADAQQKIDYITDHHSAPEYKPVWRSARILVEKYMLPPEMRTAEKDL